jgi:hypothetical protein
MAIGDVVKAIAVTAELTGAALSGEAVAMMASDLTAAHAEVAILRALTRCRKELSRPLTAGAVFDRLAEDDGRPSGDEAWAIALQATDEADTVVWNEEIQQALSIARPILDAGDKIGARMAFRDAYERTVRTRREAGIVPKWSASLGWDQERRIAALESAQAIGLLPAPQVAALLPSPSGGVVEAALFGGKSAETDDERTTFWIRKIKADLKNSQAEREARRQAEIKAQQEDLAERKRRAAELVERELHKRDAK